MRIAGSSAACGTFFVLRFFVRTFGFALFASRRILPVHPFFLEELAWYEGMLGCHLECVFGCGTFVLALFSIRCVCVRAACLGSACDVMIVPILTPYSVTLVCDHIVAAPTWVLFNCHCGVKTI